MLDRNTLVGRPDGTFVGDVNGMPYHIISGEPYWDEAQEIAAELGDDLPMEQPSPLEQPPLAPAPMPTITRRQLRLALLKRFGLTSAQVEAQIAALPRTPIEREAAMIEWQDATTYERDHWLVIALGAALGLPTAQIDDAWREAATL